MVTTEFISDCRSGNEDAIRHLVRTHQREVFQLALSILDHSDASLDEAAEQAQIAAHESFILALDRIERYRQDTSFSIWLSRITIETSRKRLRAWQRMRWIKSVFGRVHRLIWHPAKLNSPILPAKSASLLSPTEETLWQAVRILDDRLRIPLVLRYYHDLQINEIASILRLNEGAIIARLDQAREKLAQL